MLGQHATRSAELCGSLPPRPGRNPAGHGLPRRQFVLRPTSTTPRPTRSRSLLVNTFRTTRTWRFIRHFLEMLAAMVLGMLILAPLWPTIDRVELQALVMATNMTIGMAALMAVRRHAWSGIVEMSAAMYAPFIILFLPYWVLTHSP